MSLALKYASASVGKSSKMHKIRRHRRFAKRVHAAVLRSSISLRSGSSLHLIKTQPWLSRLLATIISRRPPRKQDRVDIPSATKRGKVGAELWKKQGLEKKVGRISQGKQRSDEDDSRVQEDPFHRSSTFEKLDRSNFSGERFVSSGINGDIYKYQWRTCHKFVAVKKLRNDTLRAISDTSSEDALTEIAIMSYLSRQSDLPNSLLKMLGVYSEARFTWLVTEFAEGGELFEVAAAGRVSQLTLKSYIQQMLQAVGFLHRHRIGHRDISLENALIMDGNVKVMDFGNAVSSHSHDGIPLRYFQTVGKDYYRPPECYLPPHARRMFVKAPDDAIPKKICLLQGHSFLCEVKLPVAVVPGQSCSADVSGYTATPLDVFAVGICMFILAFQCPPWRKANLSNAHFAHFSQNQEHGLEELLRSFGRSSLGPDAMYIMKEMLNPDPAKRPSAADCLTCAFFLG